MPPLIPILLSLIVLGQILCWRQSGTPAKVGFTLLSLPLLAQSGAGALHAWGETRDVPWTIGYLVSAVVLIALIYKRFRRP
ncbi:MAG: hypothetical protein OTJ44_09040 [Planctomycetota bacterium]|nr:hypothetical protein [Planctomycetota bacterium]